MAESLYFRGWIILAWSCPQYVAADQVSDGIEAAGAGPF
jgi:hypothetical protein